MQCILDIAQDRSIYPHLLAACMFCRKAADRCSTAHKDQRGPSGLEDGHALPLSKVMYTVVIGRHYGHCSHSIRRSPR